MSIRVGVHGARQHRGPICMCLALRALCRGGGGSAHLQVAAVSCSAPE